MLAYLGQQHQNQHFHKFVQHIRILRFWFLAGLALERFAFKVVVFLAGLALERFAFRVVAFLAGLALE